MARINRTRYAVLGMLTLGPRSGYDLTKEFETRVRHFWHESPGQIYPMLRKLRDEKLVTARRRSQGGRPDRIEYSITPAGREEFRRWLAEPTDFPTVRNELLLKLFHGPELGVEGALGQLRRLVAQLEETMVHYEHFSTQIDAAAQTEDQAMFWHLSLDLGREIMETRLRWAQTAIAQLERRAARPTSTRKVEE